MVRVPDPANITGSHFHCSYDAWNRLVEIKAANDSTVVLKFEYDGLNRRIKKHIDTNGGATRPWNRPGSNVRLGLISDGIICRYCRGKR